MFMKRTAPIEILASRRPGPQERARTNVV